MADAVSKLILDIPNQIFSPQIVDVINYQVLHMYIVNKSCWVHAVFFIRNSVKNKLVVFLIFPKIFDGFCFLVEEKMMVFVS